MLHLEPMLAPRINMKYRPPRQEAPGDPQDTTYVSSHAVCRSLPMADEDWLGGD